MPGGLAPVSLTNLFPAKCGVFDRTLLDAFLLKSLRVKNDKMIGGEVKEGEKRIFKKKCIVTSHAEKLMTDTVDCIIIHLH